MGIMANPFYVDMGYTKGEVASITKVYGVIMTLVGAFVGGALAMRMGVLRVLMLGAVLSAGSNLLFAWLGSRGHDLHALIAVISADNFSSGISHRCIRGLPVIADERALLRYAVRFVQFHDGAIAQVSGLGSRRLCQRIRLHPVLHRYRLPGVPVLVLIAFASRMKTDSPAH